MDALFAPHLNQSHAEMRPSKPSKVFSAISKLGRSLKLAISIGSRNTSQHQHYLRAPINDTSASMTSSLVSSTSNRVPRGISKQFSMETVSSNTSTVPSSITSSPASAASATTLVPSLEAYTSPKRMALIPSIESFLDIPVSSAPQVTGAVDATRDVTGPVVGQIAPSDSLGHLFSSESSSSILAESAVTTRADISVIMQRVSTAARPVNIIIPDVIAAAHECTVHDTSDASSVEITYNSVLSGPSTAETLVDDSAAPPMSPADVLPSKRTCEVPADVANSSSEPNNVIRLAPQDVSAVDVSDAIATAAVGLTAVSDSFGRLFSSDSSSTVASELSSSAHESAIIRRDSTAARPVNIVIPDAFAAPHECTLHDPSGDSSVELTYQFASSGPSTAETLVDELGTPPLSPTVAFSVKTPCEVTADDSSASSESHDNICPTSPAPAGPSTPAALEDTPVKATIDWGTTPTWTDCFEDSDSECALICELASDDDNTSKPLGDEAEIPPSSPIVDSADAEHEVSPDEYTCFGMLPSFGMAGEFLMTHIFAPYTFSMSNDDVTPIEDLSASWPVRVLTDIMEEDESEGEVIAVHVVRASPSHDSLLAVDSDKFEYSEYSLPSADSASSDVSDYHRRAYTPRSITRCCMHEDLETSDDQ